MCPIPEGVEVKISCDLIKPIMQNREIVGVNTYPTGRYASQNPEGFDKFQAAALRDHIKVENIQTKGKFMYWTFTHGWYLFSTFGMSGQWSPDKGKHPSFSFDYWEAPNKPIQTMYFNDPRHFGTIKFTDETKVLLEKLGDLGWDPLGRTWEEYKPYVSGQLKNSRKNIGDLLMDQKIFAGVGNYIRAEALYEARVSPWRSASQLTPAEVEQLTAAIINVMKNSYDHQGATILTYKNAYGAEGKYSSCFKVYGKKQDPDGLKVMKETMPDGRSIHWCPEVQK